MYIIDDEIKEHVNKLTSFEKMYQQIRVVDPINNKVLDYTENHFSETTETCFSAWQRNEVCKNCISMRAYNENDTFVKIEFNQEKIFLITAIPLELSNRKVVFELLKDITHSMIIDGENLKDKIEVKRILYKANLAAVTDELTQIYNRRYIIEKLPVEMVQHHLKNAPLSIIMADIDFFKRINDNFGHIAGDYILKEFALILKYCIRQEKDWVARFGGEEFLICLPDATKQFALEIAERMRKEIEEGIFIYNDVEIRLTSSFGVFTIKDKKTKDYDEFIKGADKNLYQAKHNGRNQVVG